MERNRTDDLYIFLERRGLMHRLYEKLKNDDFADVVMVCLDILESGDFPMPALNVTKSNDASEQIRNEGNRAYASGQLSRALALYNKALLYAEPRSTAMKLAYSNRSALLYKQGCYSACLKDLYTCFSLGCPDNIRNKLEKRRQDCLRREGQEIKSMIFRNIHQFIEFFKLRDVNVDIPCASSAVAVRREGGGTGACTVVAARDVPAGAVLALERAVACWPARLARTQDQPPPACHYCLAVTLNLIPCTTCCYALFCSERCREICWQECHEVECALMEVLSEFDEVAALATRRVVKMRHSCSTWDDFIASTSDWGLNRMRKSTINDIFDSNNSFSALNYDEDNYLCYGKMFNAALRTSIVIYELRKKLPSFMPSLESKKKMATRSVARIMMMLQVFPSNSSRFDVSLNHELGTVGHSKAFSLASFSFINKLRSSCEPNVLSVALNNKMALVACKPIKSGDELLTIHFLNICEKKKLYHQGIFRVLNALCACEASEEISQLSEAQILFVKKLDRSRLSAAFAVENRHGFKELCNALTVLGDRPASPEYCEVLIEFVKFMQYIQVFLTNNETV